MSNIVSGDRRARRGAPVAAPINYAAIDRSGSSDEAGSSEDDQASTSKHGSDGSRCEGTSLLLTHVHLLQPQASSLEAWQLL